MPTSITSSGITFDDATTQTTSATKAGGIGTTQLANAAVTPAKLSQPYTLATAVASTSGTSIDFTGIPSWVKRITVMFNGVSTNGFNLLLVQIGAGSVTTSGYTSSSGNVFGTNQCQVTGSSVGFVINASGPSLVRYGHMLITNINGNSWVSSHSTGEATQAGNCSGGGSVSLSGTLDRIRITTVNGTDTFDAGTINISYEG